MQLGSRFIIGDLTQAQQSLLTNKVVKVLVVFCMFFVPTRDIIVSIMMTFAYVFITQGLLDEKKEYAIVGKETWSLDRDKLYNHYVDLVQYRRQKLCA